MIKSSAYAIPPAIFLEMGGWRPPVMMVDRINDFQYGENGSIRVIKHVTYNDPYLAGHFPGNPIMPGVLISEIFGQASEYLSFLSDMCEIYQKQTGVELKNLRDIYSVITTETMLNIIRERRSQVSGYLASQNLKFKESAFPGDTIEVDSKLTFSDDNGFKHYTVNAYVGKKIISQGTIINFRKTT